MTSTQPHPSPNPTIEPFTSDLTGVDIRTNCLAERLLWGSLGFLAVLVLVVRGWELFYRHYRRKAAMSASENQQAYWAKSGSTWWPKFKRHFLYAPLGKKRHNREIQLSSATNFGTLPSRLHAIFLGIYVLSNLGYCASLSYHLPNRYEILAQLRGRSGSLAVANMIALVILAGKADILSTLMFQVS